MVALRSVYVYEVVLVPQPPDGLGTAAHQVSAASVSCPLPPMRMAGREIGSSGRWRQRRSGAEGVTYLDDEASCCLGWRAVGLVAPVYRQSTADQLLGCTTLECVPSPGDL
jgi:hypothetical protein